jgi:putative ABC transport system permease protein
MLSDIRFALRQLARSPGFTGIALITLSLGIGLNSAMFNIVNSLVLQPVRFPDSGNLFRLIRTADQQQAQGNRPGDFVEIARESADFARIVCCRPWSFTLSEPGHPAEVIGSLRASAGYFSVLGVKMEMGREFTAEEDVPGRDQVIILSRAFWLSHFGGDPGVIGRALRLDGQSNEIIGVAPAIADDPRTLNSPEIYRPLALTADEITSLEDHAYDMIGRYRPGATAAQAETRLNAIAAGLAKSEPKEYGGRSLRAISLLPVLFGTGRQIILMLVGLSGFVLLIACANLANLLLARAIAQAREFAIRGALGASRTQLIRPLIAECILLAGAGGVLGILISVWTDDWLARQLSAGGTTLEFVLDWRLLLFTCGASLATSLFFGVAPAWVTSRVRINDTLKTGTRGSTGDRSQNRFRQVLVACQFALALILITGALYFARGLDQLLRRDAGWKPETLLRGILAMPSSRYPDNKRMMLFYDRVQERISALPGVAAAAISHEVPAFGFPSGRQFVVQGQPPPVQGSEPGAPINGVSPGYFRAIGTRLLSGRDFSAADRSDSPKVIIINETMARTLFPGANAIGHRLAFFDEKVPEWMEIVGVSEDLQFLNLGSGPSFQTYVPMSQAVWSYVALVVQGSVPLSTLIEPIRRAVGELDPDMAVKELMPVREYIHQNMQNIEAINHLLVGFALLGLFLAALGIYGVIARIVALRTNEIGIRIALGAQVRHVARLILGAGMRMVAVGAALGLLGAVALVRFLESAMPGLSGSNTGAVLGATALLAIVALLACWLPARRATRVDPLVALRSD